MFAVTIGMFMAFAFGAIVSLAEMGMSASDWQPPFTSPLPIATKEESEQFPCFDAFPLAHAENETDEVVVRLTPVVEERAYTPLFDLLPVEDETGELLLGKGIPLTPNKLMLAEVVYQETDLMPKAMNPEIIHFLATGERLWMNRAESTLGELLA